MCPSWAHFSLLHDEAPGLSLPRINGELTHQGPVNGTTDEWQNYIRCITHIIPFLIISQSAGADFLCPTWAHLFFIAFCQKL